MKYLSLILLPLLILVGCTTTNQDSPPPVEYVGQPPSLEETPTEGPPVLMHPSQMISRPDVAARIASVEAAASPSVESEVEKPAEEPAEETPKTKRISIKPPVPGKPTGFARWMLPSESCNPPVEPSAD